MLDVMKFCISALCIAAVINLTDSQYVGSCGDASAIKYGSQTARPLAVVDHKVFFPHDMETANEYCEESKAAIVFSRNFSRNCLSDLPRQANSLIAYGMNKAIKKTCKTEKDREEMGRKLGCFNQFPKEIGDMYKELAKKYQRSIHLADSKQRIPSACCNFFQMMKDMLETGSGKCTKEEVEYLKFFMESFSGDVLDLLCGSLTLDSEKCRTLVLPHVNVTLGMPDNDSFFPALIVLLNGL